jgi:hypothetical protein
VAQRAEADAADAGRVDSREQRDRAAAVIHAMRRHYRHGSALQATQCELERARRRPIEQLHVIQCHQHGVGGGKRRDERNHAGSDRAGIGRGAPGLQPQQRHLQPAPLWFRQHRKRFLLDRREQIAETRERQSRLRVRRATRQDSIAVTVGLRDRLAPDRRLADPRLSLDHQQPKALAGGRKHLADRCELGCPPGHRIGHAASLSEFAQSATRQTPQPARSTPVPDLRAQPKRRAGRRHPTSRAAVHHTQPGAWQSG